MPTLYVTEAGARIEKTYRRLQVIKEDKVLLTLPLARIDHLVLAGAVGLTTPAMLALLEAGVSVSLLNRWGKMLGRLQPATARNLPLRRRQYHQAEDAGFCLRFGRDLARGKLRNARNLARRLCRSHPQIAAGPLQGLEQALAKVETAADLAALRGLEGQGTRAYFAIWRQALEPPWTFERRSRRPPKDPINAMLSLGYALLGENLISACEIVGLDPHEGFFHSETYGRPALALDLMEEFRHLIVDTTVLNLVNRNRIQPDDFEPGPEGGVYLKAQGMRVFFAAYAARLHTCAHHPLAGRALSYQKIFEIQARQARACIEGAIDHYPPFLTR